MTEHTPGPWTVEAEAERDVWIGTPGGGRSIARLGDDPQPSAGQMLADAHLIAAAPTLLAACEAARVYLRDKCRCVAFGGGCGACVLDHDLATAIKEAKEMR